MIDTLFHTSLLDLTWVGVSTIVIFIAVITYTRIAGLRSFSKMSGFDFAMTVAVGSLMAASAVLQVSLFEGLVALAVLYVIQVVIALLRRHTLFKNAIDNQPLLLLKDGVFLSKNMKQARITRGDIISKLREANVKKVENVQAVVLETTGDISVLNGEGALDSTLLEDVRQ